MMSRAPSVLRRKVLGSRPEFSTAARIKIPELNERSLPSGTRPTNEPKEAIFKQPNVAFFTHQPIMVLLMLPQTTRKVQANLLLLLLLLSNIYYTHCAG